MKPQQHILQPSIVPTLRVLSRRYKGRSKTASDRTTPFEILIATILSARTKDETTHRVANVLFRKYPTARTLSRARQRDVEQIIHSIGFFRAKARHIIDTAHIVQHEHHGRVPRYLEALLRLPGVGRKTANIVRSYAFNEPAIAVDIHVHRISNRLGWVRTKVPRGTEQALERLVPETLWSTVNDVFVKFGKDVCRPRSPQCWRCPIVQWCAYPDKALLPPRRR